MKPYVINYINQLWLEIQMNDPFKNLWVVPFIKNLFVLDDKFFKSGFPYPETEELTFEWETLEAIQEIYPWIEANFSKEELVERAQKEIFSKCNRETSPFVRDAQAVEEGAYFPITAICPIHGEVHVLSPGFEGITYRSNTTGKITGTDNKDGYLECGCRFHHIIPNWYYKNKVKSSFILIKWARKNKDHELSKIIYNLGYLQDHFGNINLRTYEDAYDFYNDLSEKVNIGIIRNEEDIDYMLKKLYGGPLDNPSYTLEEYDSLSEKDKQDKRYKNYLFTLLKEVFPVYLEDYPRMKMCPIDEYEIPEKDRIKTAEFTIQLYRMR